MRHSGTRIVALLAFLTVLASALPAQAQSGHPGGALRDDSGEVHYPLLRTEVDAEITGPVVRVTVRQTFANPWAGPVDVLYSFPLPDRSAVDAFRLEAGGAIFRAEVMEREAAAETFAAGAERGCTATLLEQIRPNLFTRRIANLPPGGNIVAVISYVEDLRYEDGGYEFVFPVVAAPRYRRAVGDETGKVPAEETDHRFDITVAIDAGVPVWDLTSPSHAIEIPFLKGPRARVELYPCDVIPNRDFVLKYQVATETTEPAIFAHRVGAVGTFGLLLQPDEDPTAAEVWGREMVFVLDCSGSMSGKPNEMAKRIVERTLETLRPTDTFRILRFSDQATALSNRALPATYENIRQGLHFLRALKGDGGTEMLSGVHLALGGPRDPYRMRIVHFLTDGLIGNEPQVLKAVKQRLGDARIFPLGVGSSVNRFLLERMATVGRGVVSYIRHDAPDYRIEEEVERFVARVRSPILTDLEIEWGGLPVRDTAPSRLPDCYAGRPVLILGRYDGPGERTVVVRGRRGRQVYRREIRVTLPESSRSHSALPKLWARSRIAELMLDHYAGEREDIDAEVLALAVEHRLLTDRTAFVAVDERRVASDGKNPVIRQPSAWPQGVGGGDFHGIILGPVPQEYFLPKEEANPELKTIAEPGPSRATFRKNDATPHQHLYWLASDQQRDGSWRGHDGTVGDVGATALSLLAFRASGQMPREGLFKRNVHKGIQFLTRQRDAEGCYGPREGPAWLLDHSLATLALLEFHLANPNRVAWSRPSRAVEFLISKQSCALGWSRDDSQAGGDSLTTMVVLCVLRRATQAGIEVPPEAMEGIRNWFHWTTDLRTGRVRMTLHSDPFVVDGTAIAAAIIARSMLGDSPKGRRANLRGARLLHELPPPLGDHADPLFLFLATSALKRVGYDYWTDWRPPIDEGVRPAIVPMKALDQDGNPVLVGPEGARLARTAAMALFGMTRSIYETHRGPFTLR